MGELKAKEAVPALIKALKYDDGELRRKIVKALGKIGGEQAVLALSEVVHDSNIYDFTRVDAADILGKIGDKRAVPGLIKALKARSKYVRRHATKALGDLGDKRAIQSLIEVSGYHDDFAGPSSSKAAQALVKIGKEGIENGA